MYDVVIVGGGIIGCATAFELSKYRLSVLVIEKENDIACGTTKANSGIVHAGYDAENGTLMAKLNVKGSQAMKSLAEALDVPYRQVGSFVVGFNSEDKNTLQRLYENGIKNGVQELFMISGDEARKLEPNLSGEITCALYAKTAAVVSPWEMALALMETAVKNGAELSLSTELISIESDNEGYILKTSRGEIKAKVIVNAAGIYSEEVAKMAGKADFEIAPTKGEYYLLDKTQAGLVNRVIFQCPDKNGKGVLVAPTAHGNIIVGPNAEKCKKEDCATTIKGLAAVRTAAVKSVPYINLRDNIRNFAGVRANSNADDFILCEDSEKKNVFHAAGIKSPGLSAAPAIAEYIAEMIGEKIALIEKENPVSERKVTRFKDLGDQARAELINKNSEYGRVICRCETITEGEIKDTLKSVIPPVSIDGVKRRCSTGMGRCQGGFCGPKIHKILADFYNVPMNKILLDKEGSYILDGKTKEVDCDA